MTEKEEHIRNQANLPLCPSAPCKPNAFLLGKVKKDYTIAFALQPKPITDSFVERAKLYRQPEKRFRFASPCINSGCQNWQNNRCKISDTAIQLLDDDANEINSLPDCGIRKVCRWFEQSGERACHICRYVTTERDVINVVDK